MGYNDSLNNNTLPSEIERIHVYVRSYDRTKDFVSQMIYK